MNHSKTKFIDPFSFSIIGDVKMPIVTIEAWPLDEEKKPEIIKNITKVFTDIGIPSQAVTVILHETKMENWGSDGEQHSVKFKDLKR